MNKKSPLHFSLNQNINYQDGSVVSKEVFRSKSGTVTLFAFDKGQGLSEHKTPFDALVYIIDGEAEITISGTINTVKSGELIHMSSGSLHALKADKRFKMMLVMMKG